ncbi:ABC transporter permease subunit (plasmid) [Mesorhizobium sp. INR15]|nr:ABC transporter permease subunit [Mesorhizobium sp. INR15]
MVGFGPEGWGKPLLIAAAMTVAVSTIGFAFGFLFGGAIACAKLSGIRVLRLVADVYTTIERSVPELLVLYLLFFGGSAFLGSEQDLLSQTRGLYQPKTVTADLMMMPPSGLLRI